MQGEYTDADSLRDDVKRLKERVSNGVFLTIPKNDGKLEALNEQVNTLLHKIEELDDKSSEQEKRIDILESIARENGYHPEWY